MSRTHFLFYWPATPAAAASARRTVESLPMPSGRDRLEDLKLLLSEAVSGVVRAPGSADSARVQVGVSLAEHDLRAEVTLSGSGAGRSATRNPPELSGWGMLVVDRFAREWGVLTEEDAGIWFELPFGYRGEGSRSPGPPLAA
ncbi:MAG TPA: ATP-binding protein [Acidimicrobiales bacterium]|nr:ATP-binding protein [Acidimicrobiales bacterium]